MRDVSPTLLWSDPNPGQQFEYSHDERLIRMVARTSVGPQQRIDFTYDWQGRRIGKQVWNDTAGAGASTLEKFIYDGWNLMTIEGPRNRTFLWGLDLSGSMQGAGGVGGLLAVNDKTAGIASFVCYDGNGNVAALVSAATGEPSAQYEYGPFGEVIRMTGPMAKANPFRFSTKYQDDETDLLYYGYRYYSASTGRWISRDPIGRRGGLNLHAFVRNACNHKFDILGLVTGRFGPQVITEADVSVSDFSTDFPSRVFHVCGSSNEPKNGVAGGNCAYLRFFWFVAVNTKLPPPGSPRWSQSNLNFADDQINEAWDSDPSYQGRRAAVLVHEGKHIADMQASYNGNKDLMEGYEGWFNSKELCEKIAAMVEKWVLRRHADDALASQNKWD